MVALSGEFIPIDGTSASTPIFAGVVTLLNDARTAAGLPPLGFLNPLFYQARRERPQTFYGTVFSTRSEAERRFRILTHDLQMWRGVTTAAERWRTLLCAALKDTTLRTGA